MSVEHLFIFPDWDLTVLMVSQLGALLLDCFLSDRYSVVFLPSPSAPPPPPKRTLSRKTVHEMLPSERKTVVRKKFGFLLFSEAKFVRRGKTTL